jgi:FAD/FMN-containing dehydrogenase
MFDAAASLLSTLNSIVGETNVLTTDADVLPYVTDWRERYRGRARAVVRPGSTAEVAAIVHCCAERRVPVVPQGGNTGLCGGATPHAAGDEIVLTLARMNRVRAVDVDNATMTVEAGMPLASVQEAAAAAGMLFPSAATCPPMPAAQRYCAMAMHATSCSGSKWFSPTAKSGTVCAGYARTTPVTI